MLIKRGAEAELRRVEWHGRDAVEKARRPKAYRDPGLDAALRASRVRQEAKLMAEARALGLAVPIVYDIDLAETRLVMERIDGPTLKEVLHAGEEDAVPLCRRLGEAIGRLHGHGIVHGDLTTSNLLLRDGRLHFIDFSLGEKTDAVEAKGVDLRLLKEAFTSAHFDRPEGFEAVLEGYRATYDGASEVLSKLREIEERGRYT
jgi:Kae1-associated kinase Bud32